MMKRSAISDQRSRQALSPTVHSPKSTALPRSFTLTELMVAVVVLLVVIIATSKIFGTASKIVGTGQATSAVMVEAATLERQFRADIDRVTRDGFFAIHCVSVRNNVNQATNPAAALLDPNRPANDILRADQLVFFVNGVQPLQTYRVSAGEQLKGQGVAARMYYGLAFQLLNASPALPPATGNSPVNAHDPNVAATFNIVPWYSGSLTMMSTLFSIIGGNATGTNIYGPGTANAGPTTIDGTQPNSRRWLLVRQKVALLDDDGNAANVNSKTVYLDNFASARSIFINNTATAPWGFSREIRNGRMDAAASQLSDIRRWIVNGSLTNPTSGSAARAWSNGSATDQRAIIQGAVYYPRAERVASSMNRVDQALTNHVIVSGCSSITVDWTYDDGVGFATNPAGPNPWLGVVVPPSMERPWFGLNDPKRGVYPYSLWGGAASTILPINAFPNNIESQSAANSQFNNSAVKDYWAVFGYNQYQPLNRDSSSSLYNQPDVSLGYTPFPSALRVTVRLHDPEGRLEEGREFQFIVDLPRVKN